MRRLLVLILAVAAGCGASDRPAAEPTRYTTNIDNPYWPMQPGSRWVYREGGQKVVVTVTNGTRKVNGIEARVVHDVVTKDGELVEDTYDWYAQDDEGNVWYMGEDTKEYENGRV